MKRLLCAGLVTSFLSMLLLSGCRTFSPESNTTTQPWAQPEKWQQTQGLPGFTGTRNEGDY